eukprot:g25854.t1
MMPARFHSKAMDGLLEGSVFAYVSMYALLKDNWADKQFNPVILREAWYTPCLYIGAFCSILNVGLALVEIDHRTSACIQTVLDVSHSPLATTRHLAFRASEFSMRLLTMLAFCTFMRPLQFWWIAYILVAADYIFGVALLIILGGRDPVREACVVLGLPLFMVNIMQFVDAPGMSLQARQISEIIVPLRSIELAGVLLFCVFCPAKIRVVGQTEDFGMISFVLTFHTSWAICWAASVLIYYLLLATYAFRTKPGADLHSAVAYGEVEVLRDLLRTSELVLDISRFGPDGKNPLHLAARRGQVECMKLLVEEKADLQARTGNKQQNMALHLAAMNKEWNRNFARKLKTIELLNLELEVNKTLPLKHKEQKPPPHRSQEALVSWLLNRGKTIKASDHLILVTRTTVDSWFHPEYFPAVTFAFLNTGAKRNFTIYQPPILFLKE